MNSKCVSKKLFCILLSIVLIMPNFTMFGSAKELSSEIQIVSVYNGLSEVNVRLVVSNYFTQRSVYLAGDTNTISVVVTPMLTDENTHKSKLVTKNLSVIKSDIVFDEIECWDGYADAVVTETIVFYQDGNEISEVVEHKITVYMEQDGTLIVSRDQYTEKISGFVSCSYVEDEEVNKLTPYSSILGSRYCILNVADGEVGYTETGTNQTKYGAWMNKNGLAWCASFVSWCADQAHVSTSVIPKSSGAAVMKNFFATQGTFFLSKSQGGNQTPRAGDLFFENGTVSTPTHVGFVVDVDEAYVYVIDGNCEDKVNSHRINLTDSALIGYARPQYEASSHSMSSTWSTNSSYHWKQCVNCNMTASKATHTFAQPVVGGKYVCSVCNYETYSATTSINERLEMSDSCTMS